MTTILLVDDDLDATYLLGAYFERRGFAVRSAHSWAEATTALADESVEVLVADRQLGDGDGLALFHRGRPPWIRIAILATGEHIVGDELRRGGFDDAQQKPLNPARLVDEIASRLAEGPS